MLSAEWWPFRLCLNVLKIVFFGYEHIWDLKLILKKRYIQWFKG